MQRTAMIWLMRREVHTVENDTGKYTGIYRGKVLDNEDPEMLGRVKAEIYPMMLGIETADLLEEHPVDGIAVEILPWAVPAMSLAEGAKEGLGFMSIPRVGSMLFFFFETGSIYQPVYFASAPNAVHGHPSEIEENYPNKKVLKTESGFIIELNDEVGSETLRVAHPAGSIVTMSSDGNVSMLSPGDITLSAGKSILMTAAEKISSSITHEIMLFSEAQQEMVAVEQVEEIVIDVEDGIDISATAAVDVAGTIITHSLYEVPEIP